MQNADEYFVGDIVRYYDAILKIRTAQVVEFNRAGLSFILYNPISSDYKTVSYEAVIGLADVNMPDVSEIKST